jgi:hypothetical protein
VEGNVKPLISEIRCDHGKEQKWKVINTLILWKEQKWKELKWKVFLAYD